MEKKFRMFEAISILTGTVIGAGIFGMPYVIYKAGFLSGMILLVCLGLAVLLVNLQYGEIILSTKSSHQLAGYAEKYLGKKGKYFMFVSSVVGFYGALLAFLIGQGQVLAALTGADPMVCSLIFFAFASLLVYIGLTIIKEIDFILSLFILSIVVLLSVLGSRHLAWENLASFDLTKLFIPYGVVFFSLGGLSAIPSLREVLKGKEHLVKKSIFIGTLIPFIVYTIFTFLVIGITGSNVTEVATVGLGKVLGPRMLLIGNIFAFFTMTTSFLTIGLALKNMYFLDFKIKPRLSWLLTVSVPLVFFVLGLNDFVRVMGTAGAIGGGAEGILICLIFSRLKKHGERKPEYSLSKNPLITALLCLLFVAGVIYTFWS